MVKKTGNQKIVGWDILYSKQLAKYNFYRLPIQEVILKLIDYPDGSYFLLPRVAMFFFKKKWKKRRVLPIKKPVRYRIIKFGHKLTIYKRVNLGHTRQQKNLYDERNWVFHKVKYI